MPSSLETDVLAPSRLHWVPVLLLELVTRGFFELVWLLIQTNWARKVRGRSSAFWWSIAFACLLPGFFFLVVLVAILCLLLGRHVQDYMGLMASLCLVSIVVVRTFAVFTFRLELAEEPIKLSTGYWKTIFFGTVYLQYRLDQFARQLKEVSKGD